MNSNTNLKVNHNFQLKSIKHNKKCYYVEANGL